MLMLIGDTIEHARELSNFEAAWKMKSACHGTLRYDYMNLYFLRLVQTPLSASAPSDFLALCRLNDFTYLLTYLLRFGVRTIPLRWNILPPPPCVWFSSSVVWGFGQLSYLVCFLPTRRKMEERPTFFVLQAHESFDGCHISVASSSSCPQCVHVTRGVSSSQRQSWANPLRIAFFTVQWRPLNERRQLLYPSAMPSTVVSAYFHRDSSECSNHRLVRASNQHDVQRNDRDSQCK